MYKILFLVCLSSLSQFSWGQDEKVQKISSTINSAIIYLNGAEINRSKPVNIVKGRNKLVFTGLTPKLNSKSIQVTTTNNVVLLAISYSTNYIFKENKKPRIKQLKDSIELMMNQNIMYNNNKDGYVIEKDMLLKNKSIGGNDNGVSINELKMAADFYRTRIIEINEAISKFETKVHTNSKIINKLNQVLVQSNAESNFERGEITLLLNSDESTTTDVELKYIVTNAGWIPSYDIKAKDIIQPIDFIYRAKVYNNTNIDWRDINLKLSTGDPTVSVTQPNLTPWYLNYKIQNRNTQDKLNYNNDNKSKSSEGYLNVRGARSSGLEIHENAIQKIKPNKFVEIAISELSTEFKIEKKYTIPSDNNPYIVDVIKYKVPALFKHYSVPKLDRDAFLLARIPNWQDLNLIEGNANIYFGGTFIGQSFISTRSVNDTLDISLGRDKKVIVTRMKMKDFSSKKTLGSNRKETHAYQMVVKNNRKGPINIKILGQLPISQDSDIEVSALEISNALRNILTGQLEWQYVIESNQNKIIDLSFTVKYPKNKPVKVSRKRYRSVRFL